MKIILLISIILIFAAGLYLVTRTGKRKAAAEVAASADLFGEDIIESKDYTADIKQYTKVIAEAKGSDF